MDGEALNYNAAATKLGDAVCSYEHDGYTNTLASNYLSAATSDDGSCFISVYGCMSQRPLNFNALATVQSERNLLTSCTFAVSGCTDTAAFNYGSYANTDDGSCFVPAYGCNVPVALNFNSSSSVWVPGSCIYPTTGCTDSSAYNYDTSAAEDDGSCQPVPASRRRLGEQATEKVGGGSRRRLAAGCTVANATNFDSAADSDDGSCLFAIRGCTNSAADNFKANATEDDNSCVRPGCTNTAAQNYDSEATHLDASCVYVISGCTKTSAILSVSHALPPGRSSYN